MGVDSMSVVNRLLDRVDTNGIGFITGNCNLFSIIINPYSTDSKIGISEIDIGMWVYRTKKSAIGRVMRFNTNYELVTTGYMRYTYNTKEDTVDIKAYKPKIEELGLIGYLVDVYGCRVLNGKMLLPTEAIEICNTVLIDLVDTDEKEIELRRWIQNTNYAYSNIKAVCLM